MLPIGNLFLRSDQNSEDSRSYARYNMTIRCAFGTHQEDKIEGSASISYAIGTRLLVLPQYSQKIISS